MVPERDRKEVYDDVLFFLAKKEKVTVTGLDPSVTVSSKTFHVFASLWTQPFTSCCPQGPSSLLRSWCGTYTSPIYALGLQLWVWENRKVSEGLVCNLFSSPFRGHEGLESGHPRVPRLPAFPQVFLYPGPLE